MPDEGASHGREALQTTRLSRAGQWVRQRSPVERGFILAGVGALVLAAIALSHWWVEGRFLQSTDNAYVRADISVVSSRVSGYVRSIRPRDDEAVRAGDVLVELETADYEAALAQAQANLAQAQGELAASGAARSLARADAARYAPLARRGFVSRSGMQQVQARAAEAGANAAASRAAVSAAEAQVAAAELDLERTRILAPIDGVVGDREVRLGQLVQPGAPLMAIVPLHALYVVANYKETQLARIRPGQRATIRPDVSEELRLTGIVESIAPASGSEFSIIPQDTATGNFTKIVQRVPVRIRLDPNPEARALLRPGLSVAVTIDTRPQRAP